MIKFIIRPARESESRQIRDLIHEVGINPMGLDWKRFVVAADIDQDEMIGCGQLKPHGEEVIELASIAVKAEYRNQGIAGAIIEYLLKDGPRPLYLICRAALGPLYEKFGFRRLTYDEMPRYFQRITKVAGLFGPLVKEGDKPLIMKLQ